MIAARMWMHFIPDSDVTYVVSVIWITLYFLPALLILVFTVLILFRMRNYGGGNMQVTGFCLIISSDPMTTYSAFRFVCPYVNSFFRHLQAITTLCSISKWEKYAFLNATSQRFQIIFLS